ncbi:MAG TPA: hypothetical protein VHO06_00460, partial [Polyangia bacterium]|nr:hypothetical protein [Polyangia bacterium]
MSSRTAPALAALLTLAGCAHGPATAPPAGATGDSQVVVAADVGAPEVIAAWSVYGLALAAEARKTGGGDDFAAEVTARGLLADAWKQTRAAKPLANAYLDLLVSVREAGFLRAYVLAYLARPGWTLSGDDLAQLALGRWTAWAAGHLPADHRAITPVTVRVHGGPPAPVPGADLPAPGALDPARTPCAALAPALARAVAAWDREAGALRRVPLAVS